MGREIRRVPPNWEHPKDEDGDYLPLFDKDFVTACQEWAKEVEQYAEGKHKYQEYSPTWEDFLEDRHAPDLETHRLRRWKPEEATHYQVYETVTEGTPVSPVLSRAEMYQWLLNDGYTDPDAQMDSGLA
jgi:hypothetical protein